MQIYNSLTKQKEEFIPLNPKQVTVYACGATVYDYFHIGNARMMMVFDMVVRYLRYRGYLVKYVQNITDIDDKIIKRAQERGVTYSDITVQYIQALLEDQQALGILPADHMPRATEFVPHMIKMIQCLIDKSYAYVADNGDVLYRVKQFHDYGKLSHRNIEDLRVGARVEVDEHKHDPLDFVLWKMAKPSEPTWDSPWGKGRPGWHIECSVMAEHCLAEQIDIHGGGMDLKFPHHENEIAQTEACTGKQFARTWMHVGFLQIDNEKMSKSLGNFFLARDALQHYSGEQIRLFMLSSHYRQPINYAVENLTHAQDNLQRFYQALRGLDVTVKAPDSEYELRFQKAMDDDFNTPEALVVLYDLVREINRKKNPPTPPLEKGGDVYDTPFLKRGDTYNVSLVEEKSSSYPPLQKEGGEDFSADQLGAILKKLAGVLGLLQQDPEQFFKANEKINAKLIEDLIAQRKQARAEKNWAEADKVRLQLDQMGIVLEDTAQGTIWRVEKHKSN